MESKEKQEEPCGSETNLNPYQRLALGICFGAKKIKDFQRMISGFFPDFLNVLLLSTEFKNLLYVSFLGFQRVYWHY